jgi:cytoskeleton protein RodZ
MSDTAPADESQQATARPSAGAMLRQAREDAKLTIEEVADELHLVRDVIEALENGDRSKLPSRVFTLGYLKNYAKLVNLPYDDLRVAFDDIPEEQVAVLNQHRAPQIRQQVKSSNWFMRLVSWLLLVGLLLLVFLWWKGDVQIPGIGDDLPLPGELLPPTSETQMQEGPVPLDRESGQPMVVPLDAPPPASVSPDPVARPGASDTSGSPEAEENETSVDGGPSDTEVAGGEIPPAAETADSSGLAVPSGTAPAPDAGTDSLQTPADTGLGSLSPIMPQRQLDTIAPAEDAQPAAAGSGIRISFSGKCWVQITDANGEVLLSGEMQAGDSREIDGDAPLRFVLGNATAVEMFVNDERFDLAPHTSGNVARFTLEAREG